MTSEIGSEFESRPSDASNGLSLPSEGTYVFSGRTAITAVIDVLDGVRSALLPSYCCDSMVEPFRRRGINSRFYNVAFDGARLRVILEDEADVLVWCNYFGYCNDMPDFDGIIIEDITHSLLSKRQNHARSDYLVASLRKWEPVLCGGWCSVHCGGSLPPEGFLSMKQQAMQMKAEYLCGGKAEIKNVYLRMFAESNSWLAKNYEGLLMDDASLDYVSRIDIEAQRSIRRENARTLYTSLRNHVSFLLPEGEMDCPLFVPIVIPEGRDELQKALVARGIYCPVHWPHPQAACESNLYKMELSLVCDQRYTPEDMERMAAAIIEEIG